MTDACDFEPTLVRQTRETRIAVALRQAPPDALGALTVSCGRPFFDHMFTTLLTYAGFEGRVLATGDLTHHIVEDTAITLGLAIHDAIPERCARYADRTLPMDDALVAVAIDLGTRAWFSGELPSRLATHVLRSFTQSLPATLHVRVLAGSDKHHVIEAAFKATGLVLREALSTRASLFSTKGAVSVTRSRGDA